MELQTQVAPDATQIQSEQPAQPTEAPEVAEPEQQEDQTQEQEQPDPREKAVKNLQRRVDRLTAARYQEAARAEQAAREAEQLRQRLAQFEQQGDEPRQQQQVDPVALAAEIANVREFTDRSNKVAQEGQKRFGADFPTAVKTVIEEAGPLVLPIAPNATVGKPTPLGEAVLAADDPAAVLHYLGSNPEVAGELHGLTAIQVARRIARIEVEIAKAAEPKVSTAPKAIKPVGGSKPTQGELSPDLPIEEWMKRRQEQLKGKRL